jgi:hypothetical protein
MSISLYIEDEQGRVDEFHDLQEICRFLWPDVESYRKGDVLYAHDRIGAVFGMLVTALIANDVGHAGLKVIFPLMLGGVKRALLDLCNGSGLYYEDKTKGEPDLILEGYEEINEFRNAIREGDPTPGKEG